MLTVAWGRSGRAVAFRLTPPRCLPAPFLLSGGPCGLMPKRDHPWLPSTQYKKLEGALKSVATALKLPEEEGQKIKGRLLRALDRAWTEQMRDRNWNQSIRQWRVGAEKPSEQWACYLVRLESNRRRRGLERGKQQFTEKEAREWAIKDATRIKFEELSLVEKRAVELLRGKRQKAKSRKAIANKRLFVRLRQHPEERAIKLAEAVQKTWFPRKTKLKTLSGDTKPRLSIVDVVSITSPILKNFAQKRIPFHVLGSPDPPLFEALYCLVFIYARDGESCTKTTLNRTLRQVRRQQLEAKRARSPFKVIAFDDCRVRPRGRSRLVGILNTLSEMLKKNEKAQLSRVKRIGR
jgi:hypothetical protein